MQNFDFFDQFLVGFVYLPVLSSGYLVLLLVLVIHLIVAFNFRAWFIGGFQIFNFWLGFSVLTSSWVFSSEYLVLLPVLVIHSIVTFFNFWLRFSVS